MFGWLLNAIQDSIHNTRLEREGKIDRSKVEYRAIGWNPGYGQDDELSWLKDEHTDDDPNPSGTDEYYRVKKK